MEILHDIRLIHWNNQRHNGCGSKYWQNYYYYCMKFAVKDVFGSNYLAKKMIILTLLLWNCQIIPASQSVLAGSSAKISFWEWPCPVSAQQLLSLSGFSLCATAAAEEPFWGLMHSTAGGAKPRVGVVGEEEKRWEGGGMRSSVYWAVEAWDMEHVGRQAQSQMAKQCLQEVQDQHFALIALPKIQGWPKITFSLKWSYKHAVTETTM